ncbi:sigma-70 family RNA polymerase sigma factor [Wenzhouxiangella sp. XN79A]|uniref:sigma-70 family RNA polymerase sigma factor n=1 Tax=Wenzhouxiangella sp. XN79A TaxID=2724193 RepID=UPI00144AE592|nr:sigma-70 family RNA polymerase sigma factor [Wenzhouxiangella sp. XN79A]
MPPDFDQVIDEHRDRLTRIARQYAGPNDWQDLLQEIAVAIWRGLHGFEGRSTLSTWIYRVAVNTALQHVRKRRPASEALVHEPVGALGAQDPLALLDEFLAALDPVNRAVLLLDLEGLHRDDIGEVLGLSPGAVAVRMTRLKQRFSETYMEGV